MKKTIIIILFIISIISAFILGMSLSKKGIARSVERIQAELSFGHLQVYKELKSDILAECRIRLMSRLEHIIDEQKMLMAEYVQSGNSYDYEHYINLRDSNLIKELHSYKVDWNKSWTLPACNQKVSH